MEFAHTHSSGLFERARECDLVYVTYRDPYSTAASWANRGRPWNRWKPQWEAYEKVLTLNPLVLDFTKGRIQHGIEFGSVPLNEHHDKHGLHAALDRGDMAYFWEHVPRELFGM